MRIVTAALVLFCGFSTLPERVESEPLVVVELFTSQGCSSCPPADALMVELVQRPDVIGLSLHVDYWDYIGWKDEYADPSYTVRQKAYARNGGRRMIYTPQMVVNGQEDVVGAHAMEIVDLINKHKNGPHPIEVLVTRSGSSIVVQVQAASGQTPKDGPYDVQLVRYTSMRTAHITRGELAGRQLDYANVVDGWTHLGQWDGRAPVQLIADIDGDRPAVVLVQKAGYGPILAAARAD